MGRPLKREFQDQDGRYFKDSVLVLRWFNNCRRIVLIGNIFKTYGIRSKGRLCSLFGNDGYKNGCKTSVSKFITESSASEKDVEKRRL